MTVSKELFLAILSMDSYNHGYGAGLNIDATQIGAASLQGPSDGMPEDANLKADWQTAGFYAAAYTLNDTVGTGDNQIASGTTIISYRGTDNPGITSTIDSISGASDIFNGWIAGAGGAAIPLRHAPKAARATSPAPRGGGG
ncbi:MAG: hypothetical protein HY245_13690 [Rhizobiales bacterium]|nr:hypothetical protein [Hyphomicrobiales bacterium]MBI3674443.1 hypothetical protein [Hyphomicrobiales bacterium]